MWEETPPAVAALGVCRNAISRFSQGYEAGNNAESGVRAGKQSFSGDDAKE